MNQLLRTAFHLTMALALASCAAAKPIGEWRNSSYDGSVDHILVIGVTARSERRQSFESQFVEALKARGVEATASYRALGWSLDLTRESVEQAIRDTNIAAVMVTRLAGVRQSDVFRLPANYEDDRDYISYYDHALRQTTPAYYEDYRVLTLETSLYDVESGELVWRMHSEAIDASRPKEVIAAQIDLTIRTLVKRKLLVPKS